jgi:Na+-translocating ferredoxin:NAD+ oxidoreductase RnfD subunit
MTVTEPRTTATEAPPAPPAATLSAPGPTPGPAPGPDKRVLALTRFAVSITALNIVGLAFLGFEQAPITPLVCLAVSYASALLFEAVDSWAFRRRPEFTGGRRALVVFLLPPHITALACSMLLYGNSGLWPYVFAVVVASGSKYVVRVRVKGRRRHVLNPSNAGIVATLLLFPWVGIAPPYQFVNNYHVLVPWLLPLAVLVLGTMLNAKLTGKMPLILAWVGGFLAQAVLRWLFHGDPLLLTLLPLTGVAFILFTNYMITDPGTTPFTRHGQIVFGLTTAAFYGLLVWNGVVFGLFFSLVITCVLRGVVLVTAPAVHTAVARLPRARRLVVP